MKKLFILFLFFTNICLAQTTIFTENIGNTAVTATTTIASNIFQNSGVLTYGGTADVRATTVSNNVGASGGNNVFITKSIGRFFEISNIDTSNFDSITLSLSFYKSTIASNGSEMVIEVSSDGITYTPLTFTTPTGTGTAIWRTINPIGSIPTCYNLRIRFRQTLTTPQFRIDDIVLKGSARCSTITTWNGTSWNNGIPTSSTVAVIDGDYDTNTNSIDCCSMIVNSGKNVYLRNNTYINIQYGLNNNGVFFIYDSGSLVQSMYNGLNKGNINYNRNVNSLRGYDYVYWSSPVSNQTLASLYTIPTMGFSYQWNPTFNNTNGTQGNWVAPTATMTSAKGYIIRASSSYGWLGNLTANFTGVPNNGNISIPIERGSLLGQNDNWNLVGNPYPSSINIMDLLTTNASIDGYVSLWLHSNEPVSSTSPFYQNFQYNYSNDYLIVNGTGASNTSVTPYYISSGQGFFVSMQESSSDYSSVTSILNFTNSLRNKTYDNSIFYRQPLEEQGKIWIDLLDQSNNATRTLIGYVESATNQRDRLYDALTTESKIYSLIDNQKFIIQGRSLPFDQNDQVSLGIKVSTSGNYKIAVADIIGILSSQDVYLQDTYLNIIHDLRQSPYLFSSAQGTFNDRFILRYTNNSLSNTDFTNTNFILYVKDDLISVKSNSIIQEVKVYNILGELLYENKFNDNLVSFDINTNSQILFVKIKTNDIYLTKKIIK